jgi:hypothetical protein
MTRLLGNVQVETALSPKTRRILLADLEETRRSFPADVRADKGRETFTLAVSVVRHFFGYDWYMKHIFQDATMSLPPGYMRIDYTPGPKGEKKTSRQRWSHFLTQPAKVDSPMQRMVHHEDAETVFV